MMMHMKRHLTILNGMRIIFGGAAIIGLSLATGLYVNWSLANKIPDCLNNSGTAHPCSIAVEQFGANASAALLIVGGIVFVAGVTLLFTANIRQRAVAKDRFPEK